MSRQVGNVISLHRQEGESAFLQIAVQAARCSMPFRTDIRSQNLPVSYGNMLSGSFTGHCGQNLIQSLATDCAFCYQLSTPDSDLPIAGGHFLARALSP